MTPHDLTKAKLETIDLHTRLWKLFRLSYCIHDVLIQFN